MIYVERAADGRIVALHDAPTTAAKEQRSVMDEEVLAFINRNGTEDAWKQLLSTTDTGAVRIVEDLIDILIRKNVINFTELPEQAQQRIRDRKQLRDRIVAQELLVDDIL